MGLYEWLLARRHRRHPGRAPDRVAVILTERDLLEPGAYSTLEDLFGWAFRYGATQVIVMISVLDEAVIGPLRRGIDQLEAPRPITVRDPSDRAAITGPIQINIGLGGRREFTAAVRKIAEAVATDELDPTAVAATDIESNLVFTDEPDLLIKTGAERLSDFLIWQSVYAELYFTDVNWRDLRLRDYLRAVLDYQNRQRRFCS
ncbi:UNVERIFIED_CONTAM: UDP diphosphate synthase [Euhalothece sp. KZN 001]